MIELYKATEEAVAAARQTLQNTIRVRNEVFDDLSPTELAAVKRGHIQEGRCKQICERTYNGLVGHNFCGWKATKDGLCKLHQPKPEAADAH